jgi:hypothetical protein
MKHAFLFTALAAMLAVLLAGCPGNNDNSAKGRTSRATVINALDKMGLDKAPTLGPVFEDFLLAIYDKNFNDAWSMLNKESQNKALKELAAEISELNESIASLEAKASDTQIPPEQRDWYNSQAAIKKTRMTELAPMSGNGRKYFSYLMANPDVVKSFQEITDGTIKIQITGETVNGDKGFISEKNEQDGREQKLYFVMEDGKWKFDFYNTSAPAEETGTAPAGTGNP